MFDDPYQIASLGDLNWMSATASSTGFSDSTFFLQTSDIDAAGSDTMNSGAGFLPIGSSAVKLVGIFYDGGGHTISNLTINRPTRDKVGLFGYAKACTISNLNLVDVN